MAAWMRWLPRNGGGAHILHNETASANHWLTLRLVGHKSNRDGIGAVVNWYERGAAMGYGYDLRKLSVRQ